MGRFGPLAGWGRVVALVALLLAAALPAAAQHSVARQWNERMLDAIRNDLARPTVHARNLYHVSLAMYDAWAVYDVAAKPVLFGEDHATLDPDLDEFRAEAISFAAYRILRARFALSPGADETLAALDAQMLALGYDKDDKGTVGTSPSAIGNRIAFTVLAWGFGDGSNEAGGYANLHYEPVNAPLVPDLPGNPALTDANRWQPLALEFFIDQSGNLILGGSPPFLSPEWGQVTPFALSDDDLSVFTRDGFDYWVHHDPGPPPLLGDPAYKWGFELVSTWSSHLDPTDGVMIDVSPGTIGNIPTLPDGVLDYPAFYDKLQGGDTSLGYASNPVTGEPYAPQIVPRGDYTRILAEFWADGPDSETPPGHWFTILNTVSDDPRLEKRVGGEGPVVNDLEWDVKAYLALGGAMHDCAITAWGVKGWYDYLRPISAIRYMADEGQSSDPGLPSYSPRGISLIPGFIELITPESTAPGERHEHLAGAEGFIALKAWRGPDFIDDPEVDEAGVGWILAANWWPYQRPTFVTPPFAGYVSGHSTYSRAAAVVMDRLTGSPWFPGGLGEFVCEQNEFLVFEEGPSVTVHLQWASYYDASDQCSLSRIWGGIHPPADDIPGRKMGQNVGEDAWAKASALFQGGAAATWIDEGQALAGFFGEPVLQGGGELLGGETIHLALTNAFPALNAFLVLGLDTLGASFKGGVMVPSVDFLLAPKTIDNDGNLLLTTQWAHDVPPGFSVWYQYWIDDFTGPLGFAASNGLRSTTP